MQIPRHANQVLDFMKQKGHIQTNTNPPKKPPTKQQPSFKTELLNSLLKPMAAEKEKHQH